MSPDSDKYTNINCYSCGEPLRENNNSATRIVTIDGQQYHEKCSIVVRCTSCRKIVGFMGRGDISPDRTINCIDCAQPRQEI